MKRLLAADAATMDFPLESTARDRVRARRKARKRSKLLRNLKFVLSFLLSIVLGFAVTYGMGVWFFSSHYYPGTVVFGVDASLLSEAALAEAIDEVANTYVANVTINDFALEIPASEVGISPNGKELAAAALQRINPVRWPFEVMDASRLTGSKVVFDQNELSRLVRKSVEQYNETARLPKNATITLDAAKQAFQINDEVPGTRLNKAAVFSAASQAVSSLSPAVELDESALEPPSIRATDDKTKEALDHANAAINLTVPVAARGQKVTSLSHDDLVKWVGVNDDLSLSMDKSAFAEWANVYLWDYIDYSDDANAYVLNSKKLAKLVFKAVDAESEKAIEAPTRAVSRYSGVNGDTSASAWDASEGRYVEVNIPNQFARLYDTSGEVIWETDVTTGCVDRGKSTPLGTYYVYDKQTDFMLLGEDNNGDGEYDYELHVDYWMPFNEGIGLHDASWRTEYGGTHYIGNGSGGCVNLPAAAAKALYSMIHVGDKVIVYG